MEDTLQTAIVDLIGKATSGAETAGKFLLDEIPDVVQQLLMWHGVSG